MAEEDAADEEGEEEEDEETEDEETEDEEEDEETHERRRSLLPYVCYGVIIFFILTDPTGASKLARNLGAFIDDQAQAVAEFIDSALSNSPGRNPHLPRPDATYEPTARSHSGPTPSATTIPQAGSG